MRTPVGGVVLDRVVRETGTRVYVERTGPGSSIEQEPGWATVCQDHGGVVVHETRRLAERFASVPTEWCPTCQETR